MIFLFDIFCSGIKPLFHRFRRSFVVDTFSSQRYSQTDGTTVNWLLFIDTHGTNMTCLQSAWNTNMRERFESRHCQPTMKDVCRKQLSLSQNCKETVCALHRRLRTSSRIQHCAYWIIFTKKTEVWGCRGKKKSKRKQERQIAARQAQLFGVP